MTAVPPNPPSVPDNHTAAEGVAALIPVANITLEDALLDNPNFRANVKLFEGQVFFLESWLVALQQSIKKVTEEWTKLNEVVAILNKRTEVPLLSQGMLSAQYTLPAMKLASGAFRTMLALKHQYIVEVNERIVKPLEDFVKNDLKEFKEAKKAFDKALEKYESALAKYNGQSRQKEPSALREEAFQLYDVRKAYIQSAMSCAMLCIKFQDSLDQLILGVFLDIMATQHDYFSGNADHCGGMALQVLQLKTYMREHKEASGIALGELQETKERYTADAIEYWKPSRSLKCYANNTPATKPSPIGSALLSVAYMAGPTHATPFLARSTAMTRTPTAESQRGTAAGVSLGINPSMPNIAIEDTSNGSTVTLTHSRSLENLTQPDAQLSSSSSGGVTATSGGPDRSPQISISNSPTISDLVFCETPRDITPTTKQGYLNIRIPQPKNRAPVWQRKYFFIQEGEFGFESVVSSPSVGSQVVQSERISVAMCDVRYNGSVSMISPLTSSSSINSLSSSQGGGSAGGGGGNGGGGGLAMIQMERRFCFEVVCSTQSYVLQAETEDDLLSWVGTFEAAKREAQEQLRLPKFPDAEEPYSPMPMTEGSQSRFSFPVGDRLGDGSEVDGGGQPQDSKVSGALGWAASVPGFSLLLNSYTGNNTSANSLSTGDTSGSTEQDAAKSDATEKPEGGPDGAQSPGLGIATTTTPTEESSSASTTPLPPPPVGHFASMPYGNGRKSRDPLPMLDTKRRAASETKVPTVADAAQGQSAATSGGNDTGVSANSKCSGSTPATQLEKLLNSSHHLVPKSSPPPTSDIPLYTMELVVRNRELHHRFMGTKLHKKEYVLHSWTSGYYDDCRPTPIMVYGRIYVTQSAMYFYSRDLSIETKRMFRFSAIHGIECEQKDILTEWRIETLDSKQHVFSQFSLSDTEYLVLKLIWTNAHLRTGRRPVKDLYRKTLRITSKPKLTAGSGSLAETESTHGTRTEGIVHHGGRVSLTAPPRDSGAHYTDDQGQSEDGLETSSPGSGATPTAGSDHGKPIRTYPNEVFPASMPQPPTPVDCQCPGHLERVESEMVFKVPAKTLHRLLLDPLSCVWREFHERRNDSVYDIGRWVNEGGKKTRVIKYMLIVNNPMVRLNQTDCFETQTCEVEEEHLRYTYTVRSSMPAMPYSDSFTPVSRYCVTYVSPKECKLTCSSGIEWHKNPLVKAMIKSAIFKGTAETARDLNEILDRYINTDGSSSGSSSSGSLKASSSSTNLTQDGGRKSRHRSSSAASSSSNSSGSSLLAKALPVRPRHNRSNSSKVKIALVAPGTSEEKMLLDWDQEGSEEHEREAAKGPGNEASTATVAGATPTTPTTAAARQRAMTIAPRHATTAAAALAAAATTMGAATAAGMLSTAGGGGAGRARRHTVSTAASEGVHAVSQPSSNSSSRASEGLHAAGHPSSSSSSNRGHARVMGHWPIGEQPKFTPVGSKESRTRLLGRPSRSTLVAEKQKKEDVESSVGDQGSGIGASQGYHGGGLLQRLLYGPSSSAAALKSESPVHRQRRMLVRLLAFFLAVSSLMNMWAAWNSKRLMESTWRIQRHEMILQRNRMEGLKGSSGGESVSAKHQATTPQEDQSRHQEQPQHPPRSSRTFSESRRIRVSARAVYLKDLEDQIFNAPMASEEIQDRWIDAASFKTFMQVKESFYPWATSVVNDPLSSSSSSSSWATMSLHTSAATTTPPTLSLESEEALTTTSVVPVSAESRETDQPETGSFSTSVPPSYPWMLPSHRRSATRLVFQHDRIGILRYDLLATFEQLNRLEQQLVKAEYLNWIMDERLRCQAWESKRQKEKGKESEEEEEVVEEARVEDVQQQQSLPLESIKMETDDSKVADPRVTDEFCAGVDRQLKLVSHH
ncbi:SNF1-interacting protein [Actinomortierella ambigua]|uniref:SNF1-interacting protein n=1 Tax=Actinomortierella ambigua TaxID=1343610 RepID=A0A9P6QK42_9FUNG|nr:SNF1-interacting protein [Actinomortierella ambigua]